METREIRRVEVPLSPSMINEYCRGNPDGTGNKHILFEFDVSNTPLAPHHVLGYLSNLKLDFRIVGYDHTFIEEYIKSPFLVGESNLIEEHKKLLLENSPLVQNQLKVIRSLPLFLVECADLPGEVKSELLGPIGVDDDTIFPDVGVNFVHFIKDPELFLYLIGDKVYDFKEQIYYPYYFDNRIYDGEKLIKFFIDNPNNLLNVAIQSKLSQ